MSPPPEELLGDVEADTDFRLEREGKVVRLELATAHQVSGKQVQDARLAVSLKAHDVKALLTLSGDAFSCFDIRVVHPQEVTE